MSRGTSSVVAAALTKRSGKLISRQQVHTWWTRRDHNGFPEGELVMKPGYRPGVWRKVRYFEIDDVLTWHTTYVPDKGGHPCIPKDEISDTPSAEIYP